MRRVEIRGLGWTKSGVRGEEKCRLRRRKTGCAGWGSGGWDVGKWGGRGKEGCRGEKRRSGRSDEGRGAVAARRHYAATISVGMLRVETIDGINESFSRARLTVRARLEVRIDFLKIVKGRYALFAGGRLGLEAAEVKRVVRQAQRCGDGPVHAPAVAPALASALWC